MIGGDINHAYKLELADGASVFMKANSRDNADFFRAEVTGLEAIASLKVLSVPRILAWGTDDGQDNPLRGPCSFLLLEFLPPTAKAPNYWEELGRNLAGLHLADCSSIVDGFGFPRTITSGPRRNGIKWLLLGLIFFGSAGCGHSSRWRRVTLPGVSWRLRKM